MTLPVLLIALLGLRGFGALGVRRFATWPAAAAHALAIMLVMTASAHFVPAGVTVMPTHDDLVRMVPPAVPFPSAAVYLTGVLELLGALGLVIPRTRRAAGYCLALLFVVMLPANIYAATADVPFADEPASPLWQRIPEQILYIAVALWATRGASALTLRRAPHRSPAAPSRS
ncbi:DoxX family protein [Micromonospora echinaurantiaca]|uniref:DoxX family protein n=1 Tax=Micromonospora echinaurantiaca TaxID=47857 RepID=UPI00343EFC6B